MDRLLEGYRRFRANQWSSARDRYRALARDGQTPDTLIVACSDSRVDPQTVFGAAPGELFVIRNVAGLVPPYDPTAGYHGTSAALEYGVRVLKVSRIVVLGHARCGGVRAMVEGAPLGARDFVARWMAIAEPVVKKVPAALSGDEVLNHCEHEVVRLSIANLMTFPWIAEPAAAGTLAVQGCRFDILTGLLTMLDGDRFVAVT